MKVRIIFLVATMLIGTYGIEALSQTRKPATRKTTTQKPKSTTSKPKATAQNPWHIYKDVDSYTMEVSYRVDYTDESNGLNAMFFPKDNHLAIAKIYDPKVFMDEIIDAIVDNRGTIDPQHTTVQYRLIKGKDVIERKEFTPIAFYGVAEGQRIDRNGFYSFMSLNITADELKNYEYLTIKYYDKISKQEVVRQIDLVGFYFAFLQLPDEYHGPVYKKPIEIDGYAKFQGIDINGPVTSFEEKLKAKGFTYTRTDEKSYARYYSGKVDGEDITLQVSVTRMTKSVSLVSEQYLCSNHEAALKKYSLLKEKLTKKYGSDYEKNDNKVRLNWVIPGGNVSLDIYDDVEVSISYSDNKATQNSIKELRESLQKK